MTRSALLGFAILLGYFVTLGSAFAQTEAQPAGRMAAREDDAYCPAKTSSTSPSALPEEILLKILLVEFEDVRCAKDDDGQTPRYSARDFEHLLGSDGVYVTPRTLSPDGEEVYGSMNDYFKAMSDGKLRLKARVVNPTGQDSATPRWLRLNQTKLGYHDQRYLDCTFFADAKRAARDSGMDIETSADARLVIIYAGNLYLGGGGLNPNAGKEVYIMSEVQGRPYGEETPTATFSRIGTHCHEFAHTIGVGHTSGSRADLMQSGTRNGSVTGNAPAPLNAIARVGLGWAQCIEVGAGDTGAVDLPYSLTSPIVYHWRNGKGDDFYAENRGFNRMMRLGDIEVPDYNNAAFFPPAWPHGKLTQGILVWRHNTTGDWQDPGYSREGLLYASGRYGRTFPEDTPSETDDGVPFPGVCNVRILSPWSDPRNPYMREPDPSNPSSSHYNLYVPNTKGGTVGGFEITSENDVQGTFQVVFRLAYPPNPANSNQSTMPTATAHNSQRKLFREPGGKLHLVFESGGEIFYRQSMTDGRSWEEAHQVSVGNGGNAAPCFARSGRTAFIVWQVQASLQNCYALHSTRSTDGGLSWSTTASLGQVLNCTLPGPVPAASGSRDGYLAVFFRDGGQVSGKLSHDEGKTWAASPPLPGSTGAWGNPSCAVAVSSDGELLAHVACAGDDASGESQMHYNALDIEAGTWIGGIVLSSVLPPEYGDSRNPCITASGDHRAHAVTVHVVWDVANTRNGARRLIVHRVARDGKFGSSYSLLGNGSLSSASVTSAGGESAVILCQREPERDLWRLEFDGHTWQGDSHVHAAGGFDPQTSIGSDSAVSLWTSGDAAPFQLNARYEEPLTAVREISAAPQAVLLHQNYPNPFNASTTILYRLTSPSDVRIEIYNGLGQRVRTLVDDSLPAGVHESALDGSRLASGEYFCRFSSTPLANAGGTSQSTDRSSVQVMRMLLIK